MDLLTLQMKETEGGTTLERTDSPATMKPFGSNIREFDVAVYENSAYLTVDNKNNFTEGTV